MIVEDNLLFENRNFKMIALKKSPIIATIDIRAMFITDPKYSFSSSTWKFFNWMSFPSTENVTLVSLILNLTLNVLFYKGYLIYIAK